MLSFKDFLENLFEWSKQEAPSDPKELDKFLSGEPSRKKEHINYEDKFKHGIKSLRNDVHGKDVVRKHLERFATHSNTYARQGVAESPHIHEHPDLVEKLRNDPSIKVRRAVDAPRKKTVSAPAQKSVEAKPEKVVAKKIIAKKPSAPKAEKKASGPGTYTAEKVNPDDTAFAGAKQVTHILHNGKVVGASVSSQHGSDYGSVVRHTSYSGSPDKGFKPVSNHENHIEAAKGVMAAHRGK